MKKHVMKKWVKALRSGEFKQTIGSLETAAGYCCLGVLCEIAPKSVKKETDNGRIVGGTLHHQRNVMNWSGITRDGRGLANLNDIGISFNEIADIIEADWEKL